MPYYSRVRRAADPWAQRRLLKEQLWKAQSFSLPFSIFILCQLVGARAQAAGGGARAAEDAADALRLVDAYVKAFYLPWGDQLRHWLLTHPEYTAAQRTQLVSCIADAQGLRRKERAAFLAQLEAELVT